MDDAALYRLEGSKQEIGGLIFTKKTQSEDGSFKIPSAKKSLLGLDRLAAIRRKEKDDEIRELDKSMVTSYTDQDEGHEVENVTTGDEKKKGERHYRPAQDETPSHTGGISEEARKRLVERLHKNKERGVHYSSAKKKKRGRVKENPVWKFLDYEIDGDISRCKLEGCTIVIKATRIEEICITYLVSPPPASVHHTSPKNNKTTIHT
uniref:Uncharacterized protein n=1 Tax=Timema shepardi TaxID=629360 RepID=A0A7R9FX31_TIMSH|nr:unnamed protein product [Timema shepardi]